MNEIKRLGIGESFKINEKLAGLVPMASEAEQAALTADIAANGLKEPLVLWQDKIIDGRCRQKACLASGIQIVAKELDDSLSESDARIFVKSVNTRRNLTNTQKVISACRDSLRDGSGTILSIAKAWGISKAMLENARYIAKARPEFMEPLFNGGAVTIVGSNGLETTSNKVSAIYAFIKRSEENAIKDDTHGWTEDSYIKTQAAKEWYYEQVSIATSVGDVKYKMLVAELANFKYETREQAEHRFDIQDCAI